MSELIDLLSDGEHPLVVARYSNAGELQERIERGYVLIRFTDTRGGTELGLRLYPAGCDLANADFVRGTGTVRMRGALTLDFVDIEVTAIIDLATLTGTGSVRRRTLPEAVAA